MLREQLLQRKNVLIVEDNGTMSGILSTMVRGMGCRSIDIAPTYEEAVSYLETNRYHLILLDIVLESKRDGVALAQQIRENNWSAQAILIFITGSTVRSTFDSALAAKPDGYIVKPLSPACLTNTISRALLKRERESLQERNEEEPDLLEGVEQVVIDEQGDIAANDTAPASSAG